MRRFLPRALAVHRPGRLMFAIFTLSVALAGVFANFSLSFNAISAFDRILAFADRHQMLVSARTADAVEITRGRADADHLGETLTDSVRAAVPDGVTIVPLRRFGTQAEHGAVRFSTEVFAVGAEFLAASGARVREGAFAGLGRQDHCALGADSADRLGAGAGDTVVLGSVPCVVAAVLDVPDRPPFPNMNAAVFVSEQERSFDLRRPQSLFVLASGDRDAFDPEQVRQRLERVLDASYLQIWSSERTQSEAARLRGIVGTISNGLSLVILVIGSASIASLMSFSVAERRREIAVRLAIGASRSDILRQFLGEALMICAVALPIGIVGGVYLSGYLEEPLNQFMVVGDMTDTPFSLVPTAKTVLGFLLIATLSALGPALQAASTDPAAVLRQG